MAGRCSCANYCGENSRRNKVSSGVCFCLHEGERLQCEFNSLCCIQENRILLWMSEPWAQAPVAGKRSSAFRCPCFLHTERVAFVLCLFGTVCSLFCAVVALLLLGWDALCTQSWSVLSFFHSAFPNTLSCTQSYSDLSARFPQGRFTAQCVYGSSTKNLATEMRFS